MPLYEYECDTCARRFELIRRFSDPPLAACPSCGGPVRKLLSSPAFQFKGSGWYITDYARKGKSEPSKDGSKPAEAGDGKPDAPAGRNSSSSAASSSGPPASAPADSGSKSS